VSPVITNVRFDLSVGSSHETSYHKQDPFRVMFKLVLVKPYIHARFHDKLLKRSSVSVVFIGWRDSESFLGLYHSRSKDGRWHAYYARCRAGDVWSHLLISSAY
jgi:hypothetical protein